MRTLICYPPDFSIPTMPFGGLPLFNACMRAAGHETRVLDLGAITFHELSRRESVEGMLDQLDGEIHRLESAHERNGALRELSRLKSIPRELVLDAEAALQRLRSPETYFEPESLRRANDALFGVVHMLSVLRPRLDPRNTNFTEMFHGLLAGPPEDVWTGVYEARLLEDLRAYDPELVALTLPFSSQIHGAFRFSQWMHLHFPDVRVVVGGTGLSDAEHILMADPRFFDYVDFAVMGEGEDALPALARTLQEGGDPAEVPALFHRRGGDVVGPTGRPFVDMDATPTPSYEGIDFGLYAAPERISSLTTSRGCYYGKCTFCPESFRLRFRRRASARVWEDVRHIAEEQGIRNFVFWDPLTPPAVLEEISERSAAEGVEIHWMAEVKFDEAYTDPDYVGKLAAGGCKWLQFGFESGVQRVLDDMDKGNDLERIDVILRLLSDAGIRVGVFWFIGFPTEHEEDARETWRYLVRRRERIAATGYIGCFGLGHDVPVFNDPDRFGIDIRVNERGEPVYTRRDGGDWDFRPLHETYYSKNDLRWIEGGAALLYAKRGDERCLTELTARNHSSPPGFIRPLDVITRVALPPENGVHASDDGVGGFAFVGRSARILELDDLDHDLVRRAADGGRLVSELVPHAGADAVERLQRLVDWGVLATEPMGAEEPIAGEALWAASR